MDDQESFQTTLEHVASQVPSISMSTGYRQSSMVSASEELPQAKPSINRHDALWAAMGALQDDIDKAREVQKAKGFLGPAFLDHIQKLKKAQIDFAQKMAKEEATLGMNHYREIWSNANMDKIRSHLFDDPYFDMLNDQVRTTEGTLEQLASLLDTDTQPRDA